MNADAKKGEGVIRRVICQAHSLPNSAWNYDCAFVVEAESKNLTAACGIELERLGRVAFVEMKKLVGRQAVHRGERVFCNQEKDRRGEARG